MKPHPAPAPKKDALEALLLRYVEDFISQNHAAKIMAGGLQVAGVGFWPVADHLTFRTLDVDKRAEEFLKQGFVYDEKIGVLEYNNWFAKVYRKPGYPALFIDQAFAGARGKGSLIPDWVKAFGDKTLHHVAVRVEDIEKSIFFLEKQGVKFAGEIVGDRGTDLRQIFTDPEMKKGRAFSVIELTERHHGFTGFSPPQANRLMESTRTSY
jgi:hypothetical protein